MHQKLWHSWFGHVPSLITLQTYANTYISVGFYVLCIATIWYHHCTSALSQYFSVGGHCTAVYQHQLHYAGDTRHTDKFHFQICTWRSATRQIYRQGLTRTSYVTKCNYDTPKNHCVNFKTERTERSLIALWLGWRSAMYKNTWFYH